MIRETKWIFAMALGAGACVTAFAQTPIMDDNETVIGSASPIQAHVSGALPAQPALQPGVEMVDPGRSPSLAPPPYPNAPDGDADAGQVPTDCDRAAGVVVQGVEAYALFGFGSHVLTNVGGKAAGAAHVQPLSHIDGYGHILAHTGIIGHSVGAVAVPTTLGQTPFLGHAVAHIPIVGSTIAGPPPPWLVGVVAYDTYVAPKMGCGYTESSMFTMTDFNSPPRLRNYVNYLAPLTYTHPPIYTHAQPELVTTPHEAEVQLEEQKSGTVNVEN